jgi:uroporphyrin-3 C-methyltransferase
MQRTPEVVVLTVSDLPPNDPAARLPPPGVPATAEPSERVIVRRRPNWLVWLLALAAIVAALVAIQQWRRLENSERRAEAWRESSAALQTRVEDLATALDGLRRSHRALESRASDNAATNKVLREELLGMGERAALLEDAVARLADNRLRGEVMLRLNEAEFLLLLGEERLRLFGDVPAAIQAYNLSEAALASLDDPVLATLRQTLAQELLALRSVPDDPRPAIRAELAALAATLDQLPASRDGEIVAADRNDSRLMQLLSRLVTVRRIGERDAVLGPVQRDAAIASLRLQLELAQAALSRPDPAAYRHAIEQAQALAPRVFDASAAAVAPLRDALQRLHGAVLVPELPVLGATLQELRGLRSTRSVGALDRELPLAPSAAEPPEATPPAPEGGE